MLAEFIRDDIQYSGPPVIHESDTQLLEVLRNGRMVKLPFWKIGAVVNHPQSFRLVQQGVCKSADAECEKAANMNPDSTSKAAHAYERLKRGIRAEDFDRYDRGEILGYNPDGTDMPGPNATTFDDDDDLEEDFDEDEE